MSRLSYSKMHGTGNRILVVDSRDKKTALPSVEQLRMLGNEATGPGFDQLMWIEDADTPDARAAYRVFNADGSEVEQCGNGLRCITWLLADGDDTEFQLQSPVGLLSVRATGAHRASVSMGRPTFDPASIPFVAAGSQLRYSIDVDGDSYDIAALSMGNPHCILDVKDVDNAPLDRLGPKLERHPLFPQRANVGFRRIIDRENLRLRVYERGVGETLACGTGACAAVVSGIREDRLAEQVTVALPGGELVVSWRGEEVWLSGDVTLEEKGTIEL